MTDHELLELAKEERNTLLEDQQGHHIKIGVAYQFICGQPGPDVTCLVVEGFNKDGTVQCYDVHFKVRIESVIPDRLWRPLKHTWAVWPSDVKAVTHYIGAQALDLTFRIDQEVNLLDVLTQ